MTDTPTNTPADTFTYTNTPQFTYTVTDTPTNTLTPTYTATWTTTFTTTNTPTQTFTSTATQTSTFTSTMTATYTSTSTSTPTPMAVMNLVKTGLPTTPKAGDVVRYDLTLSVTGSQADAVTVTDDLPAGLLPTTVSFISSPAGTIVGTHITWVLGTVTPGSVTVSFTVQVDPGAEAQSVLRNLGHATSTSALNVDAYVDTTLRGDVKVTVAVYNSAGEVVKTFPVKYLSNPVDDMEVAGNGAITMAGGSVTMTWGGGRVLGTWDGTGNNGQAVADGTYYVKVDSVDAYGTTTSVTKPLTVSRSVSQVTLTVYNQAGEVVRHLLSTWSGPIDNVTTARLTASVISPTNGSGSDGVTETVVMSGNAALGTWDGRNDNGAIVNNGQYHIEVSVKDGKGGSSSVDLAVAVLSVREGGKTMVVKPNVLTEGNRVGVIEGGVMGGTVNVKVYALTGALAMNLRGVPGAGMVEVDSASLASGMYILVGEVRDAGGAVKQDFRTKVMVVR